MITLFLLGILLGLFIGIQISYKRWSKVADAHMPIEVDGKLYEVITYREKT